MSVQQGSHRDRRILAQDHPRTIVGGRLTAAHAWRVPVLLLVAALPLAAILLWGSMTPSRPGIELFQVFDSATIVASLVVVVFRFRKLEPLDWTLSIGLGVLLGALVPFTGFYPLLGWVFGSVPQHPLDVSWVAIAHGAGLSAAALAGLCVMRSGGPVTVRLAGGDWKAALRGLGFGVLAGMPLAAINAYANTWVQNRPFVLQSSVFPLLEALEPGVVEEMVYRFALIGILWMVLLPFWGAKAPWIAGLLALLIHSYAHYGNLLLTNPAMYLIFGAVLALVWGVPMTLLALQRDLESATGFHWVQDAVRFMGGL